jgi:hypothetical protein
VFLRKITSICAYNLKSRKISKWRPNLFLKETEKEEQINPTAN